MVFIFHMSWKGKTKFQDFSRPFFHFQGLNFFQFCNKQHDKMHFFSRKRLNVKTHSISLILTPVIKAGPTAQIEYNRIRVVPRTSTCICITQFFAISIQFFCACHKPGRTSCILYFSKTNSYFQG